MGPNEIGILMRIERMCRGSFLAGLSSAFGAWTSCVGILALAMALLSLEMPTRGPAFVGRPA